MKKPIIVLFISLFIFLIPSTTYAATWNPFDISGKINDWMKENIQQGQKQSIELLKKYVASPDNPTYAVPPIIIGSWFNTSRNLAWSIFGILLVLRLQASLSSPFITGRIHMDQEAPILTSIGSAFMIYGTQYINVFLKYWSDSFTYDLSSVPIQFLVGDTGTAPSVTWYFLYGFFQLLLIILAFILNALYMFRGVLMDFTMVLSPMVGASIMWSDNIYKKYLMFVIALILMKPLHAYAIGFYLDYVPAKFADPTELVFIGIVFLVFIIVLPILVFGSSVLSVVRQIKSGGF